MSRGYPVTQAMRSERRAAAAARQEEYNKLSLKEKLDRLPQGGAKKQRARLEALIAKGKLGAMKSMQP